MKIMILMADITVSDFVENNLELSIIILMLLGLLLYFLFIYKFEPAGYIGSRVNNSAKFGIFGIIFLVIYFLLKLFNQ